MNQLNLPNLDIWPKYYANQLIVNKNPNSRVALTTGWTKKEAVWNSLSADSKEKVLIAGQLYSKEGINFIIRNSFLNPHIGFLIVCGRDLSGSIKEFKSFLSGENKSFIHEEIPEEKINEFREYFSKHCLFIEASEVESTLQNLDILKLPEKWTKGTVEFPDHVGREAVTFPSEKVGFRVEGKYVSEVWLKVLDRIMKFGYEKMSQYGEKQRELIDIVTVINGEDSNNPYLPPFLCFNEEDLINYYPQMTTDKIFEGVEYTYGNRLRNHDGVNQIKYIIEELRKENYSRKAIAFTWNVSKDCGNVKSPCLDLVQALVQDDILYFTAYLRSNDMYRAWPQNAFGLLKIQKEIAEELGLRIGKMVIISCSAHIYERDFLEAQKMIEKNKPKLECEMDPRGSFVIEVLNEEILVKHIDPDGLFLQEFRGKTARELRDQISRFVSDQTHGIYLGSELYRAEQALKNKTEFVQDSEA
ncbi:thymidylate synthase [Candidatus Pacearchaeota archaeon]|nr:thymidylate synthase [Candidatus Pacearchaeota archaeon]